MFEIDDIEVVQYPQPVPGAAPLIGFNYLYNDKTVYESGPLFTPSEFSAVKKYVLSKEEVSNGS